MSSVSSKLRVIELAGDWRTIGRSEGEALRDLIHDEAERRMGPINQAAFDRRIGRMLDATRAACPEVLDRLEGLAEGANLPLETVHKLNFPMFGGELDPPDDGDSQCSNVVFLDTVDGRPVFGKNNDGQAPEQRRPHCIRVLRPDEGIPAIVTSFAGQVYAIDGMNAEGLALGHSSVGSVFQQSDDFVEFRMWKQAGLHRCADVPAYVRHMANRPLRGKGYAAVAVDAAGRAVSLEAPCPLLQVRRPDGALLSADETLPPARGLFCVNVYQLPALRDADRRTPQGKEHALARIGLLNDYFASDQPLGFDAMQALLRRTEPTSLCRTGDEPDCLHTEYSMIGLPATREFHALSGYPSEQQYTLVKW